MDCGTAILKYLELHWDNSERGVCSDSYLAYVSSAEDMMQSGLQSIEVVKAANKTFPVNYIPEIELTEGRGQTIGVVLKTNGVPTIMAYE